MILLPFYVHILVKYNYLRNHDHLTKCQNESFKIQLGINNENQTLRNINSLYYEHIQKEWVIKIQTNKPLYESFFQKNLNGAELLLTNSSDSWKWCYHPLLHDYPNQQPIF